MKDQLEDIVAERVRQNKKWGEQNHDPFTWFPILIEEVGEAAKASLEARFHESSPPGAGSAKEYRETMLAHYRTELTHVAAVALAMIECLDRGDWQWDEIKSTGVPPEPKPEANKERGKITCVNCGFEFTYSPSMLTQCPACHRYYDTVPKRATYHMATGIAHWPGQDTPVCDHHAAQLSALGDKGFGMKLSITPIPEGEEHVCVNCVNEAKKRK